ncbi:MAG: hypothetical protein MZU79_06490 [Anaerotruncus sp.]|nr:hypothetical protein [Anaerotruncus sp.]
MGAPRPGLPDTEPGPRPALRGRLRRPRDHPALQPRLHSLLPLRELGGGEGPPARRRLPGGSTGSASSTGRGVSVQVTGGDPTLRDRRELVAIVKRLAERELRPSLFTNGLLATRDLLAELAAVGLFDVAVPRRHDAAPEAVPDGGVAERGAPRVHRACEGAAHRRHLQHHRPRREPRGGSRARPLLPLRLRRRRDGLVPAPGRDGTWRDPDEGGARHDARDPGADHARARGEAALVGDGPRRPPRVPPGRHARDGGRLVRRGARRPAPVRAVPRGVPARSVRPARREGNGAEGHRRGAEDSVLGRPRGRVPGAQALGPEARPPRHPGQDRKADVLHPELPAGRGPRPGADPELLVHGDDRRRPGLDVRAQRAARRDHPQAARARARGRRAALGPAERPRPRGAASRSTRPWPASRPSRPQRSPGARRTRRPDARTDRRRVASALLAGLLVLPLAAAPRSPRARIRCPFSPAGARHPITRAPSPTRRSRSSTKPKA